MKTFTTEFRRWTGNNILSIFIVFLFVPGSIFFMEPVQAQLGVSPTVTPYGGCAIDGNLLSRTPSSPPFSPDHGDFLPGEGTSGSGGYVFTLAGVPLDTSLAFHIIDGYGADDESIFTGGSKFNNDPNTWQWKQGKPPAKDDINNTLFFFSNDTLGNIWFVGSGDRKKTNGNTYLDFELLQNPLYQNADSTFTSLGPDGGRTIGDIAITIQYVNGGTDPQLFIHQWNSNGQGGFEYVLVTPSPGTFFLATNADSAVVVPYGAFGSNIYTESAFTEVACNMNDLVPGPYACLDIRTVIVKTKASQSINAALKDFVTPIQVDISSAPVISVNSETMCLGDTTLLTVNVLSGTGPFTYLWNTGDTTQSIEVSPDTTTIYSVVVTGINGCPSDPDTATVTILPLPACYISGPDTICPSGSYEFYGPDTLSSYSWMIYGAGTIIGDSSAQMVEVQGDGTCDSSFVLELFVIGPNGCSSECTKMVSLYDTLPPIITYVPDTLLLQCASTVPVASTDSITVTDNCAGSINIMVSDSMTIDSCPNQYNIIRTWTATDTCGNFSMATQLIMIFDSIAPVLYGVPADTGVCCADSIPLPANVTAIDSCDGNVSVVLTEVVSDSTNPFYMTLTRTWTASDTCGNVVIDSQVIEVNDTLYPAGGGMINISDQDDMVLYFRVAPNPFSSNANIEFSIRQDATVSLELYNYMGVKIKSVYQGKVFASTRVNIPVFAESSMESGVFLLVLKTIYGIETRRIVLSK